LRETRPPSDIDWAATGAAMPHGLAVIFPGVPPDQWRLLRFIIDASFRSCEGLTALARGNQRAVRFQTAAIGASKGL